MSEMKEVKIVYFGLTGQGKSLNGCFVLNKPNVFKVGDFAEGETNFCTLGENVVSIDDKKYKVSILDTLGLGADITKGGLSEDDCIKQIKEGLDQHKDVKCIALVHNCTIRRMTNDENKMLNIYIRMLPPQEIWKNICIIYTNFDCSKGDEEKKEIMDNLNDPTRKGFTICLINKLKEAIEDRNKELPENERVDLKKMDGYKIQTFFMDSKTKNLEENKQSVEEAHRLIKWASELQYLDLHAVSLIITKREPEEEEFELSKRDEDIYVIKTFIRKRREKKTNKLGKISYSEWKEIPNSTREIKEMLKSHEEKQFHQLIKKYEEDKYLVECYQSQKRKVYHMSNGELKKLDWENFGEIDMKRTKLDYYYKPRPEKKDIKYFGKKEIQFCQKRRKKIYIHKLGGKDYESSQSSDDGNAYSKEIELTPIESYDEQENRRIIKYDSYEKNIKAGNKGLFAAGAATCWIPIVNIASAFMMEAGEGKYKTMYKYKQEKYKRKVNKYSTGYIEKGEWVFDGYTYFENSDPEYDRKY